MNADKAGQRLNYCVDGVEFYMRLAPSAVFPTGIDDSGTAEVDTPFWIAETPVTYELWYTVRQWALRNGYIFANPGREGSHGSNGQRPTCRREEPVTRFLWSDGIVWANALSERMACDPVYTYQENVIRDSTDSRSCHNAVQGLSNGFRMPTSKEWELAARYIGVNRPTAGPLKSEVVYREGLYWTPGNYASGAAANVDIESATHEVAWYGMGHTKNVGLKKANGLGLFDMSGNVWDLCFDRNPLREGDERVCRGGSWYFCAGGLQVGFFSSTSQNNVLSFDGLRLSNALA